MMAVEKARVKVEELASAVRRRVRGIRRARHYPLLLPHFQLGEAGLVTLGQAVERLPAQVMEALRLCDGSRTLAEVTRASGVGRRELLKEHDRGRMILWRAPAAGDLAGGAAVDAVIVSPHADDAVLSLGGLMLQSRVLVLTVFGRSRWWRLEGGDERLIQEIRLAEERLAMRLCGAELRLLDLPDAVSRGHRVEDVLAAAARAEDQQMGDLAKKAVGELARELPGRLWYLPLGLGNHLDHRLARDAAREALKAAGVAAGRVFFYEDQPYAAEGAVSDAGRQDRAQNLDISPVLPWKLELLRVYWSQLGWSRIQRVRRYARQVGEGRAVERVWPATSA